MRGVIVELAFRGSRLAERWIPLDLLWFLILVPAALRAAVLAIRRPDGWDPAYSRRFRKRLNFYLMRPLLTWLDRLQLPRWRRRFTLDGVERLEALLAHRAVIVVSLHTPSLTVLPFWLLSRGIPTASITLDGGWRTRPELIRRSQLAGMLDTPRAFETGNARAMVRYLTPGRCLFLPADYVQGRSVHVAWGGRSVPFSQGPFRLAQLSGAAVLPILLVGAGRWRYRVIVGQPVPDALIRSGDIQAAATNCVTQLLEEACRWPAETFGGWNDALPLEPDPTLTPPRHEPEVDAPSSRPPIPAPDRGGS